MKRSIAAKYYDLLAEFGYDTSKCLSLTVSVNKDHPERKSIRDDKGNIIYNNILNRILAGEEIPEDIKMSFFGEHSQFFGKIMNDGNVFNPYIHRRFLPSKYIAYFKRTTQTMTYRRFQIPRYSINLEDVLRFIKDEAHKIILLEETDYIAYIQRSACATVEDIKCILNEVLESYQIVTSTWGDALRYIPFNANLYGDYYCDRWRTFTTEIKEKLDKVATYKDMEPIIQQVMDTMVPRYNQEITLFDGNFGRFSYTYFFAGVYYTLVSILSFGKSNGPIAIPKEIPYNTASEMVKEMKKELVEMKNQGFDRKKELYEKYNNYLFDILILNEM